MTPRLVYVVGAPGVGKSHAVTAVTAGYERVFGLAELKNPTREWLLRDGRPVAVELGSRAGRHPAGFPGTDAMSMTAIVPTERWLASGQAGAEASLVIGEGARLATKRLLTAAKDGGFDVVVLFVDDPLGASARRTRRGGEQNATWVKGAITRARNFYATAVNAGVKTRRVTFPAALVNALREETGL